jgi:hypothetical protein
MGYVYTCTAGRHHSAVEKIVSGTSACVPHPASERPLPTLNLPFQSKRPLHFPTHTWILPYDYFQSYDLFNGRVMTSDLLGKAGMQCVIARQRNHQWLEGRLEPS